MAAAQQHQDIQNALQALNQQQQLVAQALQAVQQGPQHPGDREKLRHAVLKVSACDGTDPASVRAWLEAIPIAARPLNAAETIQLVTATTRGRLAAAVERFIEAQAAAVPPVARDAVPWPNLE